MSKLRVNQLETLDESVTVDVANLIDDISTVTVSTSSGTQSIPDALDARMVYADSADELDAAYSATASAGDMAGVRGSFFRYSGSEWEPQDTVSVLAYGAEPGTDITSSLRDALEAGAGGLVTVPKGIFFISDTVIVPEGTTIVGEGRVDFWGDDETVGTIFKTSGAGTAARWTDINGSDSADDTPMFVAGGNGVYFDNMTLVTESNNWSAGLFFPCVKQCGFSRFSAFGFTDGCVYLDATWSNRNSTLTSLHPSVNTSTGMNEFFGTDFWLIGGDDSNDGTAIRIQGTTRSGTSVGSSSDWEWGWGGTSDVLFQKGRLTANGTGAEFYHDVQLYGTNSFGQGVTLRDVAFRGNGNDTAVHLDRSNRILFDGCYGEDPTGSGTHAFRVTSRTQNGPDGVVRLNDKLNVPVYLDGSEVQSGSTLDWHDQRCITTIRANDMRMSTPNITANGTSTAIPMEFTSFYNDGYMIFARGTSSSKSNYWLMADNFARPYDSGNYTLGSASFRLNTVRLANSPDVSSDESLKAIKGAISEEDALMAAAEEFSFILYKLNDRIEAKGEEAARLHAGVGAQSIVAVCEKHGINAFDYGFVGKDYLYDEEPVPTGEYDASGDPIVKIEKTPILDEDGNHKSLLQVRYTELHSIVLAMLMKKVLGS